VGIPEIPRGVMLAKELSHWVGEKLKCLKYLAALVDKQAALVTAGNTQELLRLLAVKQQVFTDLEAIERRLSEFKDLAPNCYQWPNGSSRDLVVEQMDTCKSLLERILVVEKECEEAMIATREAIATELKRLNQLAQVSAAYRAADCPSTLGEIFSEG